MDKEKQQSNILVAVRIRPLNPREAQIGDWDIIRTQDNMIIVLDPVEKQYQHDNRAMLGVYHRSKEQRYAFDKVFREENGQEIYNQTVKQLIQSVTQGKNATVFAYGPTGSGKTYTMLGNNEIYGLNVLAIADIFQLIEDDNDNQYNVVISYVEIYNEMIRDLLIPSSGYLELRDDAERGLIIAGVTECKAESTEQVMQLLLNGNKRRTTEATNANQTSSRSHAVFQVLLSKRPKTRTITVETLTGKLSLIDLAGSERGTATENRGIRLMEGAKINRSLLALANVINALGDKNKKGFFVPYRDSKLTRLLKDSLGGNCKTVMITNISPASSQFEQTINSLKYANRAKNIKTRQITNKQLVSIHISEYKNIINDLRMEIEQLKLKLEGKTEEGPQTPIHSGLINHAKKEGHVCPCGKMEEGQEIRRIKVLIFENFNERIQLRRALLEIDQQNGLNVLQIKRKRAELAQLQQNHPKGTPQAQKLTEQISTLKLNTRRNLLKRQITELQLFQNHSQTKKIREQMNLRIRTKQNRDFLQIIIKNHILELQNIELQINLQIQQKTLLALDSLTQEQNHKIAELGLGVLPDSKTEEDNQDDIELEIEEEDENNAEPTEEEEEENQRKSRKHSAKSIKGEEEIKNQWNNNGQGHALVRSIKNQEEERNKQELNLKGINLKLAEKMPQLPRKRK